MNPITEQKNKPEFKKAWRWCQLSVHGLALLPIGIAAIIAIKMAMTGEVDKFLLAVLPAAMVFWFANNRFVRLANACLEQFEDVYDRIEARPKTPKQRKVVKSSKSRSRNKTRVAIRREEFFTLRHLKGLTFKDIAELAKCSTGAIASHASNNTFPTVELVDELAKILECEPSEIARPLTQEESDRRSGGREYNGRRKHSREQSREEIEQIGYLCIDKHKFKTLIYSRKISMNECARRLDISASAIGNWCRGHRPITPHRARELADFIGAEVNDFCRPLTVDEVISMRADRTEKMQQAYQETKQ